MSKSRYRAFMSNVRAFLMSSTLVGGGVFLYFYHLSSQNRKKYENSINDDSAKDMTRIGYEYYGINWGYKADSMIKEKIDTGDILFLKFECSECVTLSSMVKCYVKDFARYDFDYDCAGIAYRDVNGLFVVFPFLGELRKMTYAEFLSQPYFREVSLRRMDLSQQSKDFVKSFSKSSRRFVDEMFPNPEMISIEYEKSSEEFIKEYLIKTSLSEKDTEKLNFGIEDFDRDRPPMMKPNVKLESKVIVRSKPNRNLEA